MDDSDKKDDDSDPDLDGDEKKQNQFSSNQKQLPAKHGKAGQVKNEGDTTGNNSSSSSG